MRKNLILWMLVLAMGLSACGGAGAETTVPTTLTPEAETTEPVPTETIPVETVPEAVQLPLADETVEFLFMSGAGAWSTQLSLNRDGSFTGVFHDSEMGDRAEERYRYANTNLLIG